MPSLSAIEFAVRSRTIDPSVGDVPVIATVNCVLLVPVTAVTLETVQPVDVPVSTKSAVESVAGLTGRLNDTVYVPVVW